jgi:uncharacterized protein (TIRG00374 family)
LAEVTAIPPPPARRRIWPAVRGVLTLAALALVLWLGATHPDWGEIGSALAAASAGWIIAAGLVNILSLVVRGAGWIVAAEIAADRRLPWLHAQAAFQIGQGVNTVVPGRVGELIKVYVLNGRIGGGAARFSALLGSVAVHRLMDVVPLGIVSLTVVAFGELQGGLRVSVIATLVFSGAMLLLAARLATRPGARVRSRRAAEMLDALRGGFMVLRHRGPLALAVVLETVGWSIQIGVVWLGFVAFGIDAGPVAAGAVVIATNAATLIPLWPGNVGLVQVAVALALAPWGVPQSEGIAFGLALQGAEIITALALGGAGMAYEGIGLRRLLATRRRVAPLADPGVEEA